MDATEYLVITIIYIINYNSKDLVRGWISTIFQQFVVMKARTDFYFKLILLW